MISLPVSVIWLTQGLVLIHFYARNISSPLCPTIVIVAKPDGSAIIRAIQILRECRYSLVDLSDDVSSRNSVDDKFPQWLIVKCYDGANGFMGDSTTAFKVDYVQSQPKGDGCWNFRTQTSSCGVAFHEVIRQILGSGKYSGARQRTIPFAEHHAQLSMAALSLQDTERKQKWAFCLDSLRAPQRSFESDCPQSYNYGTSTSGYDILIAAMTILFKFVQSNSASWWIKNAMEELNKFQFVLSCLYTQCWWGVSWRQLQGWQHIALCNIMDLIIAGFPCQYDRTRSATCKPVLQSSAQYD